MDRKVLMLGWGYPPKIDGGLDVHVARLFQELRGLGVDVTLALPEERAPEKENVIGLEAGEGDMFSQVQALSREFLELARDYDTVHTHDWFGAEAGLKAKKYAETRWVATFHSLSSQRSRRSSNRIEEMERGMAERADALIAVSEMLAREVEEEYGRKPRVVHNGFSRVESNGRDVKDELGIDGDMVFYVGRHAEQKGVENLIYGFSKLEENAKLVIGGEGHMTSALKDFAEMLGVEDRVLFTGFIPDRELGDYYSSADVFVSPSIDEPFGLTVTEALEAGTPVVATETGVEEVLPPGTIMKVKPDSDSIRRGIEKALKLEEPKRYESRSWKEVAEETLELYTGI